MLVLLEDPYGEAGTLGSRMNCCLMPETTLIFLLPLEGAWICVALVADDCMATSVYRKTQQEKLATGSAYRSQKKWPTYFYFIFLIYFIINTCVRERKTQTDRQTDRLTGWLTHRQTEAGRQPHWQTEIATFCLLPVLHYTFPGQALCSFRGKQFSNNFQCLLLWLSSSQYDPPTLHRTPRPVEQVDCSKDL